MAYDPEYQRAWRASHPNYHKDWAAKHPGYHAEKFKEWYARPESREAMKAWRDQNLRRVLWLGAKHRAKVIGRSFTIDESDIQFPEGMICPVLDVEMKPRTVYAPTVDRRDNAKGYERGNIWVISKRANLIKASATIDELDAVLQAVREREASGLRKNGQPLAVD